MDLIVRKETGFLFNVTNNSLTIGTEIQQQIARLKGERRQISWFRPEAVPSDLYYTNFEHLETLIQSNSKQFRIYFKKQRLKEFLQLISQADILRNPIMHNNIGLPNIIITELNLIQTKLQNLMEPIFIDLHEKFVE